MANYSTAIVIRTETLPVAANTGTRYADAKEEIRSILQEQIGKLGLGVITDDGGVDFVKHLREDRETIQIVDSPTETERAVIVDQFFVLFTDADEAEVRDKMRQVDGRRPDDGTPWPGVAWKPFDVSAYLAAQGTQD